MIDTPEITDTQTRQTAIIRFTIPRAEIQNVMGPGMRELLATVAAQGIGPSGPVFCHHLRMDPGIFDFEVGVTCRQPRQSRGPRRGWRVARRDRCPGRVPRRLRGARSRLG